MDWGLLAMALCLVAIIEGMTLALMPRRLREVAAMLARLDDRALRTMGTMAMLAGAFFLWLLKNGQA
ncbi:MAG: DUF2065 domain-containing protein [Alcanivoracaceae bacterium]|jgi:uncharacterized protein YjeT (DUF2065 family)